MYLEGIDAALLEECSDKLASSKYDGSEPGVERNSSTWSKKKTGQLEVSLHPLHAPI